MFVWPAWPMCGNVCAITCRATDAAVVPLTLICLQFCMRCLGGGGGGGCTLACRGEVV